MKPEDDDRLQMIKEADVRTSSTLLECLIAIVYCVFTCLFAYFVAGLFSRCNP
jgi:hypothetical protein